MGRSGIERSLGRFRDTFVGPYRGYDVLIISSSTEEEASYQERVLSRIFRGVNSGCVATEGRVLVASVVDPTEGGQLIGQVYTWRRAVERLAALGLDLDVLVAAGALRVAIYHNGGRGERASPLTQSLGNSRGAQRLGGTLAAADGAEVEQELLASVVLQTSSLARTCATACVDTFWTSQLLFDSNGDDPPPASGCPLEKLVVEVDPSRVTGKALHDFGTALLADDGRVQRFFGNKQFGRRTASGEWEIVAERRAEWDIPGARLGFDFGSFRTRADLHLALVGFYDRPELWRRVAAAGALEKREKRDIDPDFIAPLVAFLGGVTACDGLPPECATPSEWRQRVAGATLDERRRQFSAATLAILEAFPNEARESFERFRMDVALEIVGFWLLHRDSSFFVDPSRVVGALRLGAGSLWLTFRRAIDMANDKLAALADIAGWREITADGELAAREATEDERVRAGHVRRLRGIEEEVVARFRVGRTEVELSADDVRRGVEVAGVWVEGSIISGDTRLSPGSRVVDSFLHHVVGRVEAEGSFLDRVTSPSVEASRSFIHQVASSDEVIARGEVVSDAFREGLADDGFPLGQVRMRVPIGYDPQASVPEADGRRMDDITRTQGGRYTFAEVRDWPCHRDADALVEDTIRAAIARDIAAAVDV